MALKVPILDVEILDLLGKMQMRKEIERFIKEENLLNATDGSGNTLLHMAARTKNTVLAKYLLDSGSKVDVQNIVGETPLMFAIENKCDELVEALIEIGANIYVLNKYDSSALKIVGEAYWTNEKILRPFLQKLQSDCSNIKEDIAKKLCDVNWCLHNVVQLRDAGLTKIMLQRGYAAQIDTTDCLRKNALHVAVKCVDVENVKILLEYNANVNFMDSRQRTPLSYVYDDTADDYPNERLNILKMLLNRGAILISSEPTNIRAIFDIFKCGNREAIKLLLQTDTELLTTDLAKLAVHALTANKKHPSVIEELRGKNFNINARNRLRWTPLMNAAYFGNAVALEFLLNEGADIDAVDAFHRTALFLLIDSQSMPEKQQYTECVQNLLEHGANVQLEIALHGYSTVLGLVFNRKCFLYGELVLAYLALQETQGISITQLTCTQITSYDRFKTYFESSKEHLSMEIYESITLLDLLTIPDKKLERYVYNEELLSKIQDFISALSNYHYFSTILQKRLSKAISITTLKKEAARIICKIMETSYERFPLIADNIISYLEQQDLKNLINVSL